MSLVSASSAGPALSEYGQAVEADERAASTVRLAYTGDLDARVDARASPHVEIPADTTHVEVDLHGVSFVDSAGLNLLLKLRRRCEQIDATFELVAVPSNVQKVLTTSGLVAYFNLSPLT